MASSGENPFDVFFLALQERVGYEDWEVSVLVSSRLEVTVEARLDVLPDRVAVRPDNHAAANRRVVGKLRAQDGVRVPGRRLFFVRCRVDFWRNRAGLPLDIAHIILLR